MEKRRDKRVNWIDVTKCFGIFAIYLGHFLTSAGKSYPFVFTHHVPLFFFISGCTENFNKEKQIGTQILKKFKSIMLPFWLFSLLSIIIQIIMTDANITSIKEMFTLIGKGAIRNSFFAASLWFLTCLFVMEIMFVFIKQLKNSLLIVVVCLGLFLISQYIKNMPCWIYNFDSAFRYIIFYAIGFAGFPSIMKLFELNTEIKKVILALSGIVALIYSIILFEGVNLLSFTDSIPFLCHFSTVLCALVVIWLYFVIAKLFEKVLIFRIIGNNTLYLCGSEWIVKTIVVTLLSTFGLTLNVLHPLSAYLYTGILLWVANKFLVPVEKKIIHKLESFLRKHK